MNLLRWVGRWARDLFLLLVIGLAFTAVWIGMLLAPGFVLWLAA